MTNEPTAGVRTPVQLRQWLIERIAGYLETTPAQVDSRLPFVELGLDSVYALTLSGDIEDTFGIEVEPTMAWDHPTVAALADAIFEELRPAGGVADE